jgi:wyosine [tRNA(Phe)-imidazoG37] synthetase (radical SAM superfamily)
MKDRVSKEFRAAISEHRRQWRDFLYVYPVVARRSKGLSVGINLNPDKRCNYSCLYCQVNRHVPRNLHTVDIGTLRGELEAVLREAAAGTVWNHPRFADTPPASRRINDIAFSGDGEPTCLANFDQAVAVAAEVKGSLGLQDVKLVVITNSTQLNSEQFLRALPILDANNGEIWAKLDAGSEKYFKRVNRPGGGITLAKIVSDIASIACGRPVVIQTLFPAIDRRGPSQTEIAAYCARLEEIRRGGGQVKLVQIHTVARRPQDNRVSPLSDADLDSVAVMVRASLPGLPVETYYGAKAT